MSAVATFMALLAVGASLIGHFADKTMDDAPAATATPTPQGRCSQDLGETDIKYFSPKLIRDIYVTDETGVDEVIKGFAPLTDDRPILEYRVWRGLKTTQFLFPRHVYKNLELYP